MGARAILQALTRLRPSRQAATQFFEGAATAAGFFGGLALVALGVAMLSAAAGVIVGGVELTALAALYARGRG